MKAFDNSEFEAQRELYAKEAKEKWGNTSAYKESAEKTKGYTKEKCNEVNLGMDIIMAELAERKKSGFAPTVRKRKSL